MISEYERAINVGVLWHIAKKAQAIHSLEALSSDVISKMRL
jgi:hypothetical protein